MGRTTEPSDEKTRLLRELNLLTNQRDGIDAAIKARKARLEACMNNSGDRVVETDFDGSAGFMSRRNFKVLDRGLLLKRCPKAFLAEGFKPTAALVDALAEKGIDTKDMLAVGLTEQFAYNRPKAKEAKALREQIIEDAKARAEARVAEVMETL